MGCSPRPTANFVKPTSRKCLRKFPYNPGHMESHVKLSSTENDMNCSPKLLSYKPKVGALDYFNQ